MDTGLYLQHFRELVETGTLTEVTWAAIEAAGGPSVMVDTSWRLVNDRTSWPENPTKAQYEAAFRLHFMVTGRYYARSQYIGTAAVLALLGQPEMLSSFLSSHPPTDCELVQIFQLALARGHFECAPYLVSRIDTLSAMYQEAARRMLLNQAAAHGQRDLFDEILSSLTQEAQLVQIAKGASFQAYPAYLEAYLARAQAVSLQALLNVAQALLFLTIKVPEESAQILAPYLERLAPEELLPSVITTASPELLEVVLARVRRTAGLMKTLTEAAPKTESLGLSRSEQGRRMALLAKFGRPFFSALESRPLKLALLREALRINASFLVDHLLSFCQGMLLFDALAGAMTPGVNIGKVARVDFETRCRLQPLLDAVLVPAGKVTLQTRLQLAIASPDDLQTLCEWGLRLLKPWRRKFPVVKTASELLDVLDQSALKRPDNAQLMRVCLGVEPPSAANVELLDDTAYSVELVWRDSALLMKQQLAYLERPWPRAMVGATLFLCVLYGRPQMSLLLAQQWLTTGEPQRMVDMGSWAERLGWSELGAQLKRLAQSALV